MEKQSLIADVVDREWQMFQNTVNIGGRAGCQDDRTTFQIMRESQWKSLPKTVVESYRNDLISAEKIGRNLVAEKYARMMEYTSPAEYAQIRDLLPSLSSTVMLLAEQIAALYVKMDQEAAIRYPKFRSLGRPTSADGTMTSSRTYLWGELLTYSEETLLYYLNALAEDADNLVIRILEQTARSYGYPSLDEAEKSL